MPDRTQPSPAEYLVRPLTDADAEASQRLNREAFGFPGSHAAAAGSRPVHPPGMRPWGVFVADRLVAKAADREYDSWFGGAAITTCGVADVVVEPEARGVGYLTPLFGALLESARKRGAVIGTLLPAAPQIYRRFGFEVVGEYRVLELPSKDLAAVRAPRGEVSLRRAGPGDLDAVRHVYDAWAAAQNGPLTRRGPSFPADAEEFAAAFTGVTLAEDAEGTLLGYAAWDRGSDNGPSAAITVRDLVSTAADATRALLRSIGSSATVAPITRVHTSGADLLHLVVPTWDVRLVSTEAYMLTVLDVPGALTARRYPTRLDVDVVFAVDGERWQLSVRDGRASCEATDAEPDLTLDRRGLAVSYAGVQSLANLRMAGLASGPEAHDEQWDCLFAGRQLHIRDRF